MKIRHALLIDDNDIDNYISRHIVAQSQIAEKITVKSSAIAALEYLRALRSNPVEFPDMIFLDIRMPEMDGFGFLEEFVKFPEAVNNQCAVVMLSSSNDKNDIERSLQYPVVKKYLTKPLALQMLENLGL